MTACIGFAPGLRAHPVLLPEFQYAWLEAPLRACLEHVSAVPDWHKLDLWPAGRLFGPQGEYRWQRCADNTLHTVLLLEADTLPEPFVNKLTLKQGREDAAFVLWGDWVKPQDDLHGKSQAGPLFYANEIPGMHAYPLTIQEPLPSNTTPRLLVRFYYDAEGAQGEFVRCVDFCMQPSGEKA